MDAGRGGTGGGEEERREEGARHVGGLVQGLLALLG
jgi:hypothetical protein